MRVYFGKLCKKHPRLKGTRVHGECTSCRVAKNRDYLRSYMNTGIPARESVRVGYICELVVAADLNARCGRAYPNPEPQTPHDVYVRTSQGWKTVQCKKAAVLRATGRIYDIRKRHRVRKNIISDIVAMVDLDGLRVWYVSDKPLPPEIPNEPVRVCSHLVVGASPEEQCLSLSTRVPAAKGKSNSLLSTTKRRKAVPAAARSKRSSSVRQRPSASVATVKEE